MSDDQGWRGRGRNSPALSRRKLCISAGEDGERGGQPEVTSPEESIWLARNELDMVSVRLERRTGACMRVSSNLSRATTDEDGLTVGERLVLILERHNRSAHLELVKHLHLDGRAR